MADNNKRSRLNRKSFIANSLFFMPAMLTGVSLGNMQSDEEFTQGIIFFTQNITLILFAIYIFLAARRLHDMGKSGWYSLLIVPFPIIVLYLFYARSSHENKWGVADTNLRIFGITAKGWRILGILPVGMFMIYLALLFTSFLFE